MEFGFALESPEIWVPTCGAALGSFVPCGVRIGCDEPTVVPGIDGWLTGATTGPCASASINTKALHAKLHSIRFMILLRVRGAAGLPASRRDVNDQIDYLPIFETSAYFGN
jgi:hypothetical protein